MARFVVVVVALMVALSTAAPKSVTNKPAHNAVVYPPNFPTPTETYSRFAQMDATGNYFLFWWANSTHIQFEAHVKTRGYVGFGISNHGNMYPADVVIGWVKDGKVHFEDRHTIGYYEPIIDDSQDWTIIAGFENDFGTVLKFSRALDTCDEKQDFVIKEGTTKAIFSYHPDDPIHETGLTYHGAGRRGSKSLLLLDMTPTLKVMPADTQHFDMKNQKFHVPAVGTFYHCTVFKVPVLPKKHHLIMYEPVITPGNADIVHHMVLYTCPSKLDDKYDLMDYRCYTERDPLLRACTAVFLAWAVGGEPFYLPDDAGLPLGTKEDPSFLLLETHYNNPTLKAGVIDSSGMRIHYTPTLRLHDAGVLETGVMVDNFQIIPPEYESFKSRGYCSMACMERSLTRSTAPEMNVFAVFQHTHLIGKGIRTRIIRNGTEIEPLIVDDNYDFDFQETRLLAHERKLQVGDAIITECDYRSKEKGKFTFGGLSTQDEMCLTFILYYPRMPMSNCLSLAMYNAYIKDRGEKRALIQYLETLDWKNHTIRESFQQNTDQSVYTLSCMDYAGPMSFFSTVTQADPVTTPYVKPKSDKRTYRNMHRLVVVVVALMATLSAAAPKSVTNKPAQNTGVYPPNFPTPTETYSRFAQMDATGNYFLFWWANSTHIQFEAHVKTRGYVGFGISNHGNMYPADVVIGWVKDGKVHFEDRHTIGFYEPIIDDSQDWTIIAGFENDFGTVLKFSRALDTCDEKQDFVIKEGTTKAIFAYHPDDPIHETGLTYHGAGRRGSKSLLLLDTTPTLKVMPADSQHFDITNQKFQVPAVDTYYHCSVHKMPVPPKKNHLIMFEPVITPGNEDVVHHMVVYTCPTKLDDKYNNVDYHCYEIKDMTLMSCRAVFLAWAVGGEAFYLPTDVGIPLGMSEGPGHVVLETHYNNPTLKAGVIDSSGIRIHYTPTLRLHDAGVLETGVMVDPFQIIPPEYESFKSRGYCNMDCMERSLTRSTAPEMNVFAVFQHTHLIGKGVRTRVIRNGTEIEPLIVDDNYDFDFQETRLLAHERKLQVGDAIITECDYRSKGSYKFTFGGVRTSDEMCLSFILYYPRSPMSSCLSLPLYDTYIKDPHHEKHAFFNYLVHQDWRNQTLRDVFQKNTDDSIHVIQCADYSGFSSAHTVKTHPDPVTTPYVKPKSSVCSRK
ncbi:uncharacterized protein [Haliotis cracherodii]|uniref:uncharacterized protein n=1 Tax=Haliotis cracherodii TaxID=6455 RepID=UPI0039E90BBE